MRIVLIVLLLVGCTGGSFRDADHKKASELCANNGGLDSAYTFEADMTVSCKNGARFVDIEKSK